MTARRVDAPLSRYGTPTPTIYLGDLEGPGAHAPRMRAFCLYLLAADVERASMSVPGASWVVGIDHDNRAVTLELATADDAEVAAALKMLREIA